MNLPHLKTTVLASDPYRTVCLVPADSPNLVLAECNGSGKAEVAQEIVKRCNAYSPAAELVAAAAQDTEAYLQDPTVFHAPEYFESVLAALKAAQTLLGEQE